ncbi:hypothetical protein ACHHYP_20617 [Achlya hypogyna]|uniref:Transmembrane protein n=1 Tax=Achlya hypogyna TaxID=1202772 RepID=A0A1V9YHA3_ACHHY|nr:hypothetical protein ACHHYP_20617 [Achlya hypogyna]
MLGDAELARGAAVLVAAMGALLLATFVPSWFIYSTPDATARFGLLEFCTTMGNSSETCYSLHLAQRSLTLPVPSSSSAFETFTDFSICGRFGINATATTSVVARLTGVSTHDMARYLLWECDSPHLLSVGAVLAILVMTLSGILWTAAIAVTHRPWATHIGFGSLWLLLSLSFGWVFAEAIARAAWSLLVVGACDHLAHGIAIVFLIVAYVLEADALPALALYQTRFRARLEQGIYCV